MFVQYLLVFFTVLTVSVCDSCEDLSENDIQAIIQKSREPQSGCSRALLKCGKPRLKRIRLLELVNQGKSNEEETYSFIAGDRHVEVLRCSSDTGCCTESHHTCQVKMDSIEKVKVSFFGTLQGETIRYLRKHYESIEHHTECHCSNDRGSNSILK